MSTLTPVEALRNTQQAFKSLDKDAVRVRNGRHCAQSTSAFERIQRPSATVTRTNQPFMGSGGKEVAS